MRIIRKIWDYFRPSWEGPDNRFSYKRFSQFLFMWLIAYLVLNGVSNQWAFNTLLVLAVLFSLTATIITTPELIKMVKFYSQTRKTDVFTPGTAAEGEETPDKTVITTKEIKQTENTEANETT